MQSDVMKFDPATGEPRPYPSHAEQWRKWHGHGCAWLFNPWTGGRRDARDVGSDIHGRLIAPPGTLGSDLGVETVPDNKANACQKCGAEQGSTWGFMPINGNGTRLWQKCPLCCGDGISRAPRTHGLSAIPTRISYPCHGCNGTGMVATP